MGYASLELCGGQWRHGSRIAECDWNNQVDNVHVIDTLADSRL